MERLLIEWGKLDRSETLEANVMDKAKKLFRVYPDCTNLIVGFQVTNPVSSSGKAQKKVSMELRLPNNKDIRSTKEGENLFTLIGEAEKALLAQKR